MDINSIIDKSINITNNLDDISILTSNISNEVKNNLFNKDRYAASITEITNNNKIIERKILLTRELMKQSMLSIQSICNSFGNLYMTIIEKRNEKNSMSGENQINSISMVDKSLQYFFFTYPEDFDFSHYKSNTISIEDKTIEECGSINTLLGENLSTLQSDVSWLGKHSQNLSNSFVKEVNDKLLVLLKTLSASGFLIVSLSNEGTENEKNQEVIDTANANCDTLILISMSYKLAVLDIIKILTAIKKDSDIMIEALNQYISVDSLL